MDERRRRIGFEFDDDDDGDRDPLSAGRRPTRAAFVVASVLTFACFGGTLLLVVLAMVPPGADRADRAAAGHGHDAAVAAVRNVFDPLDALERCRRTGAECADETRWVVDQAEMARTDLDATTVDAGEEPDRARALAALTAVGSEDWGLRLCDAILRDGTVPDPRMRDACRTDGGTDRPAIDRLRGALRPWRV